MVKAINTIGAPIIIGVKDQPAISKSTIFVNNLSSVPLVKLLSGLRNRSNPINIINQATYIANTCPCIVLVMRFKYGEE